MELTAGHLDPYFFSVFFSAFFFTLCHLFTWLNNTERITMVYGVYSLNVFIHSLYEAWDSRLWLMWIFIYYRSSFISDNWPLLIYSFFFKHRSLVTLLEYAEEELRCKHVVLSVGKKRSDRGIYTWYWMGFFFLFLL